MLVLRRRPAHVPRSLSRRLRAAALGTAALCGAALLAPLAPSGAEEAPTFTATALPSTLAVNGHGWGHGRGMGQYGALGYATGITGSSWGYSSIVEHFYGGTTVGHVNDNPLLAVLLKSRNAQAMVIYRETGLQVTGLAEQPTAVRVELRPDGQLDVRTGTSCADTARADAPVVQVAGPVRVDPVAGSGDKALRLCNSDGSAVAYRGALVALAKSSRNIGQEVVNVVNMDDYLKGVVPRESPASWGDASGGAGMAALRAQAVVARSYAAAGDTRWGDLHTAFGARATTCDDTFCQVYGGLASISPAETGVPVYRTDPRTDQAVDETAGEVRIKNGVVARTEFSSSTGGWTAGGTFPAVLDEGDAISSNPNHAWSTSVARSTIETKYDLGTLTGVQVLERNNLGDMGGRVVKIRLTGTSATVDLTGNQLRSGLGLKSDWYDVTAPPPPAVQPRTIDTACPAGQPSGVFVDVAADSPHRRAVDCVAAHEIAQGTSADHFTPAGTVTRAQMASFVARLITAAGGTLPSAPPDAFDDDNTSVHQTAIDQLAAVDVVNGVAARTYDPQRPVDRAQVASILARALTYLGVTLDDAPLEYFTDDEGSVHETAINQLAAEGVVTGTSSGVYQPTISTRRDQMASIVARALDLALES
jgi:SpoIID/LytB domain protein